MSAVISRRFLLLTAPALAAAPVALATPRAHPATQALNRLDLPWWRARLAAKQAEINARGREVEVVFYGDSITQNFELTGPEPWRDFAPVWQQFYGHRQALNLGFKGDATCHLRWRLDNGEADHLSPRACVVLIGANNFGKLHWPAEPSFDGVNIIIQTLRRRLPRTKILLLGVLPSIRNPWVDEQTATINRLMAARYAAPADPFVTYQDLGSIFDKNGHVDAGAFLDPHLTPPDPPLHPSVASARAMLAAIEPWMQRALAG